ncbi:hypothetical protein LINPERHAP2_LOCUS1908 [Linum perenne]
MVIGIVGIFGRLLDKGGRVTFGIDGIVGMVPGSGGNPDRVGMLCRGDHTGKLFTIELHYGGVMIGDAYRYGHIAYMDLVDPDKLSLHELNKMVEYLGVYGGIFEYLWLFLGKNSQMG